MFCRWSLFNLQELVCALKLYNTQKNGKEKINHVYIFDLNKDKSIAFVNILTYFLFYQYFFLFCRQHRQFPFSLSGWFDTASSSFPSVSPLPFFICKRFMSGRSNSTLPHQLWNHTCTQNKNLTLTHKNLTWMTPLYHLATHLTQILKCNKYAGDLPPQAK